MSTISKTGIEPGSIIKSEHVLRIINALDGTDAKDLEVNGTVYASYFAGNASALTNVTASTAQTSSYSTYAITANTASYVNSLIQAVDITGSLSVTGSITGADGFYLKGNKQFNYGAFSDLVTQSGSANVSASFQLNTTDQSDGVTIVNNSSGLPTQITVSSTGVYNLQFSAQISQAAGAADVYIWFKKNGTNIANSATVLSVPSNSKVVAAWNFIDSLNAGDYLEIAYQSTSANTTYPYIVASGNIPAIPSVIVTLTQVS